jgi:hypothetical protein
MRIHAERDIVIYHVDPRRPFGACEIAVTTAPNARAISMDMAEIASMTINWGSRALSGSSER